MEIQTRRLILVQHSPEQVRNQIDGMNPEQRAQVSPVWLEQVRVAKPTDFWILGFALIHRATGAVIGSCGYKGPPGPDGIVEIAYGVSPDQEGNGYATEAAAAMTEFAFDSGLVQLVCAHTRAEDNSSARVLTRCGFQSTGQVIDPEDGPVWRWERHRNSDFHYR